MPHGHQQRSLYASVASNTGTIINNAPGVWTTQNATGFQTGGLLTTTGTINATLAV